MLRNRLEKAGSPCAPYLPLIYFKSSAKSIRRAPPIAGAKSLCRNKREAARNVAAIRANILAKTYPASDRCQPRLWNRHGKFSVIMLARDINAKNYDDATMSSWRS